MSVNITFDQEFGKQLKEHLDKDGPFGNWELFQLAYESAKSTHIPTFDGLQAPNYLPNLTPLPHQLEVARQVVENMHGKAILADEVGLGKTIEAGLILKEYMIRGLVKKVLILAPASLVSQWARELNQKFHIPAVPQKKDYVWDQCDIVVSSIDTAKRSPHREKVLQQNYDLVIIDEAHKLKNHKTKNYEFAQLLKKRFCLLLTATPIQNKIEEIFYLVSLLKPGHLGNESRFSEQYKSSTTTMEEDAHLRELVSRVMIRNRRQDTGIEWTKRKVETIPISFSKEERELYDSITALKDLGVEGVNGFSLLTLQREACSSREAVYTTLKNMIEKNPDRNIVDHPSFQKVFTSINNVTANSKAQKVLEIVKEVNDKVIVFTEYRASQLYLQWYLQQNGISSVPFRGGFKRGKKDWMRELFENRIQVLIATEAGGEGINLQFCHHLINYDLPWNPMRLEQRIGRIHRLGQKEDVHIYNFAIENTVEDHILSLLYKKIELFTRVIGELDDILTRMEFGSVEKHLEDILHSSKSEGEMKIKLANLTSTLEWVHSIHEEEQHATERNSSIS
ncbi:DEAD/DEAH box helicase [Mangrovibacillus cuniculi]|uniref:DEAD/DEAH box helicase n=1 Tax=Mangrovibacillus cuniculi TaxID=2593652 RepID=A0A7S8HFL0_9BACI|nr:SNF2-related protein [Mangrovibacillus cuniculi]QPC46852.1 DEAD/DEAH box helicase [Mangrovibacillus cuniculi]